MREVGRAFRAARVAAIYLVHGSFAGLDMLGVVTEIARWYPAAGEAIGRLTKAVVDSIAGDVGNYTPEFAELFSSSINAEHERRIPVRLFHWSSENHHIGRADGAVRLIDELSGLDLVEGDRVLLWGHSHAGNVFALVTNLLAGDRESVERFFEACRIYYRSPLTGRVDLPVWQRVHERLMDGPRPLAGCELDMVTFGTPVRYGWDRRGCGRLLHFVHHRPRPGLPPHVAAFPPRVDEVLAAAGGDYVQQVGIAGTNAAPHLLAWRSLAADRRLNQLLQPEHSVVDLVQRLQIGARVHDTGTTLLVDYQPVEPSFSQHLAGHAVYTRKDWLLFHAEEVARSLYGEPVENHRG